MPESTADAVVATTPIRYGGTRYDVGDALPLSPEKAKTEGLGAVVRIHTVTVPPLPEDVAGRDALLAAGVETLPEMEALSEEELLAIDGIGPATAQQILTHFDEDA